MRRNRGFTLIELMISIALFGLIAAGAMSLVMSSARSQARAARVDIAQSGVRAGIDFITRDLLSASAGASSGKLTFGATGVTQLPIVVVNNTSTGSAPGTDTLDLWLVDPSVQSVVLAQVLAASTSVTVDQTTGFTTTDWVLISDLTNAMLVKPSAINSTSFTLPSANTLPAGVTSFPAGSFVFKLRHLTYAISGTYFTTTTGAVSNGSVLTVDMNDGLGAQPLADGVEDLQVALGFDNNADGIVTEIGNAAGDDEWTFNYAGETAPATLANLKSVRVTLVVKGTQAEPGLSTVRPKAEDRAVAASADSFIRRTLRTEVTVRNFNL